MRQVHKGFQVTDTNNNTTPLFANLDVHNGSLYIVVEQVSGKDHVLNHLSIPAACFTHPEISMVGLTEVSTESSHHKTCHYFRVLTSI